MIFEKEKEKMKKDDFIKLGLDEETAKKCEEASMEELKLFIPKSRFDEVNTEKKNLETDKKTLEGQLEILKNTTGDVEGLKKTITELQADNKKREDEHAAEIKRLKVDAAVESAITLAKGKNSKAIRALLNLEDAEFNDDGSIKGLKEQLEALTNADDSKFLFDNESKTTRVKGAKVGESGNEPDGSIDTSKMTYSELAAYMAENPDVEIN